MFWPWEAKQDPVWKLRLLLKWKRTGFLGFCSHLVYTQLMWGWMCFQKFWAIIMQFYQSYHHHHAFLKPHQGSLQSWPESVLPFFFFWPILVPILRFSKWFQTVSSRNVWGREYSGLSQFWSSRQCVGLLCHLKLPGPSSSHLPGFFCHPSSRFDRFSHFPPHFSRQFLS